VGDEPKTHAQSPRELPVKGSETASATPAEGPVKGMEAPKYAQRLASYRTNAKQESDNEVS